MSSQVAYKGVVRGTSVLSSYHTMRELVAEALRQQVLSGELPPGALLQQERLAHALGVSRQPVREALGQLEAEGYVVIEPHRRVLVRELSREDVEELYVLRSAIESFAAELAIKNVTPKAIESMRSALSRMEELDSTEATAEAFLLPDYEFHHTLYEATNRSGLLHRISGLEQNSHRYVRSYMDRPGSRTQAIVTHRPILQATVARDPQALKEAVTAHLESTIRGVLADLDGRATTVPRDD